MPPGSEVALVAPARFPKVSPSAGHYESFFLKACHPNGGLGVWIRYTVHKRPGAAAKGFLWFTLFDATAGVVASKAEYRDPAADQSRYIRMGPGCEFAPGRVVGRADSDQLAASWELQFEGAEPPVWHLPGWMYRAPLPRTKLLSPHPAVVFTGWVRAGERRIEVAGWPGTVGHNWGTEHAKRSIWLHGANFAEHKDAWLDVACGRVAIGPITTPWIANGTLCLDGRRHRLGGVRRVGSSQVEETATGCRFRLLGDEVAVDGVVSANRERFVGWIYAQPSGGERQTVNCSIADMRLEVSRRSATPLVLEVKGGAAYELQMEERRPEIPIQPFPDG